MSEIARTIEEEDDHDSVSFSLQSNTLPKRTKKITSLRSICVPDSSITYLIERGTFSSCMSLQSISIPDSVTCIGENAFEYCTSLKSITIPESVTHIGDSAFNGCRSLRTIAIPKSVFAIRSYAFENCTLLESVIIPNNVTYIEDCAFAYCPSLKCIALPSSLMFIGRRVFDGCDALEQQFLDGINNNFVSIDSWLSKRFDNLPIHQACYDITENNMTLDSFKALLDGNKRTLDTTDSMGMTPLHILSCNPAATRDMIKMLTCNSTPVKCVNGFSPIMMFLACKGLDQGYDKSNYFHTMKHGPKLNDLLKRGLLSEDVEKLLAYDDEVVLVSEMEKGDGDTGLYPFMTAATLPHYGLDMVYKLAMKHPSLVDRF